jgi:uncharacterized protein with von Willebrand factor type A (vWA) domain
MTGPDLADVAARFSTLLHSAGVPVTPERGSRLASSMALAPPATVTELYWLARITLVSDHGSIPTFDAVFGSVFEGIVDPADFRGDSPPPPTVRPGEHRSPRSARPSTAGSMPSVTPSRLGDDGKPSDQESLAATASGEERLRHHDFAQLTPDELAQLRGVVISAPRRPSRRRVRHRTGGEWDVRASMRRARRSGGEPFTPVRRRRRVRPRRLVLICDISGSMEAYARAYLQLLWRGVTRNAEAFVFATRLTRLTGTLRSSPDLALERAGRKAPDWSGGTRIGDAIKAFNDGYGRRGLARGAVIVILSDGWDTGDPGVLAREMERLQRLAHRIVWVNPRKAAAGYEPLVGGMAAALPFVDAFVSGHSLAALDEVLEAVAA